MSLMQPLILIVDDDAELSTMLVELLAREGWSTHTVLTAGDGERAVVARVRALLRRAAPNRGDSAVLRFAGLSIDILKREVTSSGGVLALTSVEFKLLVSLAKQPGTPLTREALSEAVQAGSYQPQERTVDVQIARLRRKLREASPGAEWIGTVRGEGYVFVPRGGGASVR